MKYVAAVLLVQLSGKTPDAKNVKKVLSSVGAAVDEDKLSSLLDKLEGQNIKVSVSILLHFKVVSKTVNTVKGLIFNKNYSFNDEEKALDIFAAKEGISVTIRFCSMCKSNVWGIFLSQL